MQGSGKDAAPFLNRKGESAVQWYFVPLFTLAFAAAVFVQTGYDPVLQWEWFLPAVAVICVLSATVLCRSAQGRAVLCLLLGAGAGFAYAGLFTGMVHQPLASLDGKRAAVSAVVTGYPDQYADTQRVALEIDTDQSGISFWMPKFSTAAYLPLTEQPLAPGDRVQAKLSFYTGTDTGGFDRAAYYAGQNVHILAECDNPLSFSVERPPSTPWRFLPQHWAHALEERLRDRLNEGDAALLQGILFGNTDGLSMETEQAFQRAGLSHVLAVSGMNVGFLALFFTLVLGKRVGLICSLLALLVFVPMTGATPSVVRAAVMYAIAAFGFFLRREHSALHSLCAALLLLLVQNPYAVNSLSLQLSFLATLGLILFGTPLQRKLCAPLRRLPTAGRKALAPFADAAACSVGASAFTTPVLLHAFGYVSAAAVLANVLTVGVFALLFICGLLLCILGAVPAVGAVLAAAVHGLCAYVTAVAEGVGSLRFLLLSWDFWYVRIGIWVLYALAIAGLLARRRVPFAYSAAAACALVLLVAGLNADTLSRKHAVEVFSSGSGQCIAVSYGQDQLAVIDCAGAGNQDAVTPLLAYMNWNGFDEIDLLILTSLDKTHARDLPTLLQTVPVGQIILPETHRESEFANQVLDAAAQLPVTRWSAETERPAGDTRLGLSLLLGGDGRKLGVRIAQGDREILTLHSFTPAMLEALVQDSGLSCGTLILSEGALEEGALPSGLRALQIYIPSTYVRSQTLSGVPVQTARDVGELHLQSIRPREGGSA